MRGCSSSGTRRECVIFEDYYYFQDNALTVVVFKRNGNATSTERNAWNLLGKYHSHYLPIRDILFGPAASDGEAPRLLSLGEDQELVEYDLQRRFSRISFWIIPGNRARQAATEELLMIML